MFAPNKVLKHVLPSSTFSKFHALADPPPLQRVMPAALQLTATLSKISLFVNKQLSVKNSPLEDKDLSALLDMADFP